MSGNDIIYLSTGEDAQEAEQDQSHLSASIDVLHDDVLVNIFLYFPAHPHWTLEYSEEDATWLYITHVSRRWRNLSLSSPLIWFKIICKPAFWAPLCLQRAQSAPIRVKLEWSQLMVRTNPSDELVATVLGHLDHTRRLILEAVPAPVYNRFVGLLQRPAESLEVFTLVAQTAQGLQPLTIPDNIFAERAPRLHHLRLEGLALRFSWTNHIFSSGLTMLSLEDLSEHVCKDDLFAALRRMGGLKFVQLKHVMHLVPVEVAAAPGPPPPNERITLPALEQLYVADHVFDVCELVAHISIPPFANVKLEMIQRDEHPDAVPSVAAAARTIAALAGPRAASVGQGLTCAHRTTAHFDLNMVTPKEKDGDLRKDPRNFLFVTFEWKAFNARAERATTFLALLAALPLHAAYELTLISRFDLHITDAAGWLALGALPATEVVNLTGHTAYGFVHILSAAGALPRLRKLSVGNAHFASPSRSEGLGVALVERLPNAPLEYLSLRQCSIVSEQLDAFRRFSGEVISVGAPNTWGAVGTSAIEPEMNR